MILVTGGTGLIGSHLLFYLAKNQHDRIRAIYRSEFSLQKVKQIFERLSKREESPFSRIEWLKADINDIPALEVAFQDVDYVFHCAGFISFVPSDFEKLIKINVEGTANVVNLCLAFGVKKLCHVSSVAVFSSMKNTLINELSNWNPDANNSDYAISKHGGEMEVWRGSQEGLRVVIVNPSVVLGAYFWQTGSGQLFKRVYDGISFFPTGGTGFVNVTDVAKAMISLQFSDIENEQFILNGKNTTYQYIFDKIATELGVPVPKRKITHSSLRFLARIDGFLSFLKLKKRKLNLQSAEALGTITSYDGEKITRKIDFHYTNIEKAIKDICSEFRQYYP